MYVEKQPKCELELDCTEGLLLLVEPLPASLGTALDASSLSESLPKNVLLLVSMPWPAFQRKARSLVPDLRPTLSIHLSIYLTLLRSTGDPNLSCTLHEHNRLGSPIVNPRIMPHCRTHLLHLTHRPCTIRPGCQL